MMDRLQCPRCGDPNYATDPQCLSCGADLDGAPTTEQQPAPSRSALDHLVAAEDQRQERAYMHQALSNSPALRHRAREQLRAKRARKISELLPQVEGLIAQGYHMLPKSPGERRSPAEDVSDLCRELGECYYRSGVHEEAARWCAEAVSIHEGNIPARCYLVGALCELGEYHLAREWYKDTPGDILERNVVRGWLEEPDEERQRPMATEADVAAAAGPRGQEPSATSAA